MANIKIGRLVMGVAQTNCYFIYRTGEDISDKEVIFVDPADHGEHIYETLKKNGFRVAGILLTHGHFDHIMGVSRLRELSGGRVYACEAEQEVCENAGKNVSAEIGRSCTVHADTYCKDGEEIVIAGMRCRLIATPGHTQGSCCYYFEEDRILISGDTLFQQSVGRTDLPTGSMSALTHSIREKLFVLPDDVQVYPGHGEMTDIAFEKENNPFCQEGYIRCY